MRKKTSIRVRIPIFGEAFGWEMVLIVAYLVVFELSVKRAERERKITNSTSIFRSKEH